MDHLSSALPASYQQMLTEVVTVRRDDIRRSLSDTVAHISQATLTDFDWATKASVEPPTERHN